MTTAELKKKFNEDFSIDPWPTTYEVDAVTYSNVCQSIFEHMIKTNTSTLIGEDKIGINIILGPHNGIMFKGVELILKGANA